MEKNDYRCRPDWNGKKKTVSFLRFLPAVFMVYSALSGPLQASAQPQGINQNLHNVTIDQALKDIAEQMEMHFFFSNDKIDTSKKISVNIVNSTLEQALLQIFRGQSVDYEIDNNIVLIKDVKPNTAAAQQPAEPRTVKGVVRDSKGEPLSGAYITVKGASASAISGNKGEYSITVPSNNAVLQFSFLGKESQEVSVGTRSQVDVTLQESSMQVEEVVITGMAVMDRRIFTGATDKLSADDVMIAGVSEVSRALEGRSAGVSVQNVSGTFGAAPKIRIRGATSIYGDSKPLWVVDGVIIEDITDVSADDLASGNVETLISSAISGLNADDIESFQILKDGSATSIYGARAMAGVIVITTKRGQAGASQINYSGEFTIRMRPSYSQFNIMNSQEQMSVYQDMHDKGWLRFAETFRSSAYGVYGKMYELNNSFNPVSGQYELSIRDEARNAYLREAEYRNTDWFKELFHTSVVQTHSVSVSAGSDKTTFYGSTSIMYDPGWTDRSSVKRLTANTNFTHKIIPNLSLTMIATGVYRHQEAPGTQDQEVDNLYGQVKRGFDINPYSYSLNTSRTADAQTFYRRNYAPFNIHHELENNYIILNVTDLKFQGELKWKIIPGIEVSVLGALKYSTSSNSHYGKDASNQAEAYRAMDDDQMRAGNPYLYLNPDKPYDLKMSVLPEGGFLKKRSFEMLSYDFRTSVNWNKSFGSHYISFYGGMETNAVDRNRDWFNAWGVQYSIGEIPYYVYEFFKQGVERGDTYYSIAKTRSRNAAFFGVLTYSYKSRYILNGTLRYEGSNQLGKSRRSRWLPTWNVSGRWNIHEEKFFESARKIVNALDLRASYSLTADKVPSFITNSEVLIGSSTMFRPQTESRETALDISALENSELTYEKKHEINLGLDVGLFNNRLSITMDAYKRDQFDLIGQIYTKGTGGFSSKYANVASLSSKGIEFSLASVNIRNKGFTWMTNFIFSKSANVITSLLSTPNVMTMISGTGYAVEGRPVRALYSIRFMGLTDNGVPIIMDPVSGKPNSGYVNFYATNWKEEYFKYEGPSEPTVTGSIGNTFRYKNLNLNVFITYSFGNKVRLDPAFRSSYSDMTATPREFSDRWMVPGDELTTNIPVILSRWQIYNNSNLNYLYNAYNYTDIRMADGGFVRMKEIALSYDFPKRWIQGWKIRNLGIKFQVTNAFLIYSDKKLQGQDPEFFQSGGVAIPMPRQYTLTLKISM